MSDPALMERLTAFVGQPASPVATARDAVNTAAIRRWCDAMGDANPLYREETAPDGEVAVAPPAMMEVWTMDPFRPQGREGGMAVLDALDAVGFIGVIATNLEQDYLRYLRPGEVVSYETIVEAVSEEKRTGVGVGHFVTVGYVFRVQGGEVVGRMRFRLLKFRPPVAKAPTPPAPAVGTNRARHPRPNFNQDSAFFWEGIQQDKLLYRRCTACGRIHHPPGPMCPHCHAMTWATEQSSGRGVIHSFVVMHHPAFPPFENPNPVGLIELEEGFRFVAGLQGFDARPPRIGDAVELIFYEADDDLRLPAFRPAQVQEAEGAAR